MSLNIQEKEIDEALALDRKRRILLGDDDLSSVSIEYQNIKILAIRIRV